MGFFGDGIGGGDAEVDLEDAEEGDVLPVDVDMVGGFGIGRDLIALSVDFFAEEGFGGVGVVGFEVGVAGVGDGGTGGEAAAKGEALHVVLGDVGGFAGVAAGASADDHAGLGDGLDAGGGGFAATDGLGPDYTVLGTAWEIFGDIDLPRDGDGLAWVDGALDFGDEVAGFVLEADPAVNLGVGGGRVGGEAELVVLAGDDVGRSVDAEGEGFGARVLDFDGATSVDFVGAGVAAWGDVLARFEVEADGGRGDLDPSGVVGLAFGGYR